MTHGLRVLLFTLLRGGPACPMKSPKHTLLPYPRDHAAGGAESPVTLIGSLPRVRFGDPSAFAVAFSPLDFPEYKRFGAKERRAGRTRRCWCWTVPGSPSSPVRRGGRSSPCRWRTSAPSS